MQESVSSAPAKIILFGEHGVNRQQPALSTAVDLRTYCHVQLRNDGCYHFQSGDRFEDGDLSQVKAFKRKVDELRAAQALDTIRELARDFYAPMRYVLGHFLAQLPQEFAAQGLNIEWRSSLPIGSGLGSGAAAATSMAHAIGSALAVPFSREQIVEAAWQGDIIAHGGVASSLDSSTATYGGLIRYTVAAGAEVLPFETSLNIVIGDTLVQHNTAALNTHVRRWLEEEPGRMHYFRDMGWLVRQAILALESNDAQTLGNLMNIHQLIQEKLGTSVPQAEALNLAALNAGALGAKISGSGGGGIVIALVSPETKDAVAAAINQAGGRAYSVTTGTEGVRSENIDVWQTLNKLKK